MPHERLRPTYAFTAERIEELRRIVPEAFADGKMNWTELRESLGDWTEDEGENAEHFGLTWPGKRDARRMAALPSQGALVPVPNEGVDEETTRNIFIEGDNLEVLKLLQKSYAGRVKMIYIDPPYNTGSDFIYEDDFKESIETYLRRTGQLGEDDKPLTTNTRADGRFHSKWLSMMYPRLRIARSFLRDDGFLLVSIDDTELPHLRMLVNELYGEENTLAVLTYDRNRKNDARFFSVGHEYMLVACKSKSFLVENDVVLRLPKEGVEDVRAEWVRLRRMHSDDWAKVQAGLRGWFKALPDDDPRKPLARFSHADEQGPFRTDGNPSWPGGGGPRYEVLHPKTKKPVRIPKRGWVYATRERMQEMIDKGLVAFGPDETTTPGIRTNLFERTDQVLGSVHYSYAQTAAQQFDELFGGKRVFDNPKPFPDIAKLVEYLTGPDDLVLDFFAGSGTTGHAVYDRNRANGSQRSFVLIQLPEPINSETRAGKEAANLACQTVADVAKERLRRVIKAARKERKPANGEDLGFRVFRLMSSSYRPWQDYVGDNLRKVTELFAESEHPLVDGWTTEALLFESMLLEGFPLDSEIERLPGRKNKVDRISSTTCSHVLVVCLDERIVAETLQSLDVAETDIFVCLDSALTDEAKLQLADRCLLKTI
jgi:adenine-specific DNA-methyltransferase